MNKPYVFDAARFAGEREQTPCHKYYVEVHQGGKTFYCDTVEATSVDHARNLVQNAVTKVQPKHLDLDAAYEIQVSRRFKITQKIQRHVDIEDI